MNVSTGLDRITLKCVRLILDVIRVDADRFLRRNLNVSNVERRKN